ncbi:hypothetical protein NDU88_001434, partial [Pleurodeles waltl]
RGGENVPHLRGEPRIHGDSCPVIRERGEYESYSIGVLAYCHCLEQTMTVEPSSVVEVYT